MVHLQEGTGEGDTGAREASQKADSLLDEGLNALKKRQKHKEVEHALNKCQWGGSGSGNKRRHAWFGADGPSSRPRDRPSTQEAVLLSLLPQRPARPAVPILGLCIVGIW